MGDFGMTCYAVELGRPRFPGQHDGKAGGGDGARALLFQAFWYFTSLWYVTSLWYFTSQLTASRLLVY
jgi:hypothetical protein